MDAPAARDAVLLALRQGRVVFDASGAGSPLDADTVRDVLLPLTTGAVARSSLGRRRTVAVLRGPGSSWLCAVHEDLTDPSSVSGEVFATSAQACARAQAVLREAVVAGEVSAEVATAEDAWRAHAVAEEEAGEPGPPFRHG